MLRDYFAPGAVDFVYRDVARCLQLNRATQSVDEYVVRFDLLRRKAVSITQRGGGPGPKLSSQFSPMKSAFLPLSGKSLAAASLQRDSEIATVARPMRRDFGLRGGVARNDVLAATDVALNPRDDDYAERAAYRKAKKKKGKKVRGSGDRKEGGKTEKLVCGGAGAVSAVASTSFCRGVRNVLL